MIFLFMYLALMVVAAALCGWHLGLNDRENITENDVLISCILIVLPFVGIPFALFGIAITHGNKEARKFK